MPRGRPRENKGPCIVCGKQDNKEIFRPLKTWSLEKAIASPSAHSITVQLAVGDQLCQKHYNLLVAYDRGTSSLSVKKNNSKDLAYNISGSQQKRICLTETKVHELLTIASSVDKLKAQIVELEIAAAEQSPVDGIKFSN